MRMRVCIGSPGRFHTFDLGRQMERLGHLHRLYTGYPRFEVDGLPQAKVSTFPWLLGTSMGLQRFGLGAIAKRVDYTAIVTFDRWMARRLEPCDVFHSLSSFATKSHRIAKQRFGALTVCDHGSSHICFHNRIMAEEHERLGLPYAPIDPRIVERELSEYECADLVVVPSEFAYQSFIKEGCPVAKMRKNPFGADLRAFRPAPKEDDTFRVIYVGQLSIRKGIPYLLEAIAGLDTPQIELWLIGSVQPEMRPFLARYADRFRYFGTIHRNELYRYYSQASVFVMASIEEGLAMVQPQAMACGLPIVATTNTGVSDLVTDGVEGFIVPIRDPQAIREKVLQLYHNRDLREAMARAALARVRAMGGWNEYGERAAQLYAERLRGH